MNPVCEMFSLHDKDWKRMVARGGYGQLRTGYKGYHANSHKIICNDERWGCRYD